MAPIDRQDVFADGGQVSEIALWIPEGSLIPKGYREVVLVTVSGMIGNPMPGFLPARLETFEEKIEREAQEEVDRIAPGLPDTVREVKWQYGKVLQ